MPKRLFYEVMTVRASFTGPAAGLIFVSTGEFHGAGYRNSLSRFKLGVMPACIKDVA